MENASKALIIAGAILLAIVIISLGLIVVNNTRNTVDTANLNEQETQAFNDKFVHYEGTDVVGSRVKTLLQTVIASNQASGNKVSITYIDKSNGTKVDNKSESSDISTASSYVTTNGKYNVTIKYENKSLVSGITIKEK